MLGMQHKIYWMLQIEMKKGYFRMHSFWNCVTFAKSIYNGFTV